MALLQTKKSYVRYISHELRTPLNTAFLGLKLLTSELKASKSPDDIARYDTLCDVNMSCTAALDILNDLLCYEKLESGRMDLHAENVCVLSFLSDCLSLFSAESRERGITISLLSDPDRSVQPSPFFSDGACGLTTALRDKGADTGTSRGSSSKSDQQLGSLYASDTVLIDRFKMDQVVRNLISNALKFTDLGGEVTVAVSFLSNVQAISTSSNISLQAPFDAMEIEGEREGEGDVRNQVDLSATAKINSGVIEDYASHPEIKNWQCCKKQSYAKSHTSRKTCIKTKSPITETDSVNGKLVLIITDTGAGISDENQKRLFKEIVQFNPEKLQSGGGSGLGLWITAGILDLHSGSIRVHSDGEGQGTSFIVELPMTRHSSVTADSVTPHALTPPSTATTAVTPIRLHHLHHHHDDEHKNEDENEKENENENETREHPVLVDLEENFLTDSILPYQRRLFGRNSGSSLTHGQPGLPGQSGSDNLSVTNHTPSHISDKSEGTSVRRKLLPVNASTVSSEENSLLFSTLHLKNSKYSPADNSLRNIEITSRNSVLEKDDKKDLIVRERKMTEDGAREEKTSGEVEKVREMKSSGIKTAKAVEKKEVTNTNNIEMVYADEGAIGSSVAARHYNILVVDDSRLNRKMLLKCLRTAGHTCIEGEDGSEALALVKERMSGAKSAGNRFDAILMDFVMPIMDGPTATKEIRALGYSAPIFGVTGNGECDSICSIVKSYGHTSNLTLLFCEPSPHVISCVSGRQRISPPFQSFFFSSFFLLPILSFYFILSSFHHSPLFFPLLFSLFSLNFFLLFFISNFFLSCILLSSRLHFFPLYYFIISSP